MQFRELRRTLQAIVLAGLPAACDVTGEIDSTWENSNCSETVSRTLTVELPTDPALELRVESCRVDADACFALCRMLMARAMDSAPETCSVLFGGDEVEARTSYTIRHEGQGCPAEGRRPAGLVSPRGLDADNAVGAWLAQAAWLEAASIPAFVYLARELEAHGAPRGLARAAVAAARDEIRHAQIMTRLAHRFGGRPPTVDVPLPQPRSLEALAIENAVEGCVRETWGAVVAMWQANRARDVELRAAFRSIADDEARHAALAWAVDRWVSTRLDEAALERVAAARAAAVDELFDGESSEALVMLGLPHGLDARGLVERTARAMWNGGVA